MCVHPGAQEAKRGSGTLGAGVEAINELQPGCWNLNLSPHHKAARLLTSTQGDIRNETVSPLVIIILQHNNYKPGQPKISTAMRTGKMEDSQSNSLK